MTPDSVSGVKFDTMKLMSPQSTMKKLIDEITQPVNELELEELNQFLTAQPEADWLNLTQLHGLLCAILSSPLFCFADDWLGLAFNESLLFTSQAQASRITLLLARLQHQVAKQLESGKPITPLLYDQHQQAPYQPESVPGWLIEEWCDGYLLGAHSDPAWREDQQATLCLLPFKCLVGEVSLAHLLKLQGRQTQDESTERLALKAHLPHLISELYHYWHLRRYFAQESEIEESDPMAQASEALRCPCGSGKLYRECCLSKHYH